MQGAQGPPPGGLPKELKVSTITAIGGLGSCVRLPELFARIALSAGAQGFVSVKFDGKIRVGDAPAAACAVPAAAHRKAKRAHAHSAPDIGAGGPPMPVKVQSFNNQATLVLAIEGTRVNIKVFRNGRLQMTGLKQVAQGGRAMLRVEDALREIDGARPPDAREEEPPPEDSDSDSGSLPDGISISSVRSPAHAAALEEALAAMSIAAPGPEPQAAGPAGGRSVVEDPASLGAGGYKVCLINSDFDLGFRVKRDLMLRCVNTHYPSVACSYEPCMYPGAKIKYMWNSWGASVRPTGVCSCSAPCLGKGDGDGDGRCRKVTIAVFQSGKVIITGAHTEEQLSDAFSFLVDKVVSLHGDEFRLLGF